MLGSASKIAPFSCLISPTRVPIVYSHHPSSCAPAWAESWFHAIPTGYKNHRLAPEMSQTEVNKHLPHNATVEQAVAVTTDRFAAALRAEQEIGLITSGNEHSRLRLPCPALMRISDTL